MRSFGIKSAVLTLVLLAIAACTSLNAAPVQPNGQSAQQYEQGNDHGW